MGINPQLIVEKGIPKCVCSGYNAICVLIENQRGLFPNLCSVVDLISKNGNQWGLIPNHELINMGAKVHLQVLIRYCF